ncbi:MAG: phosphotransferase [Paracoccaceae bacterium]|nr:phosphotransferase [Paracoccaceae bacterium]
MTGESECVGGGRPQSERRRQMQAFLALNGFDGAALEPIGSDASRRTYVRIRQRAIGSGVILMDAPPESGEDIGPFVDVARRLRERGLSAPETWACDQEAGFLLLEDFGDRMFGDLCAEHASRESDLYEVAVDVLCHLHRSPAPSGLAPYDRETFVGESLLFTEWYVPGDDGCPPSAAVEDALAELMGSAHDDLTDGVVRDPVLVLRDYHAENIMWLPKRDGIRRCGLIDFQDAVSGHPAYDLVSLLEDARRDTGESLRTAMKRRYIDSAWPGSVESFETAYSVLGAQRNLRILGVFARLCLRDGKPGYVDMIPRVWDHLQRDLRHPVLAGLATWVRRNAPVPTAAFRDRMRRQAGDA